MKVNKHVFMPPVYINNSADISWCGAVLCMQTKLAGFKDFFFHFCVV